LLSFLLSEKRALLKTFWATWHTTDLSTTESYT
jgi:hypothetical protein